MNPTIDMPAKRQSHYEREFLQALRTVRHSFKMWLRWKERHRQTAVGLREHRVSDDPALLTAKYELKVRLGRAELYYVKIRGYRTVKYGSVRLPLDVPKVLYQRERKPWRNGSDA